MAKKKNDPNDRPPDFSSLRTRAEERLAAARHEKVGKLSQEEVRKLVHELETHQIELEIQNEDLRSTQQDLEASRRRYSGLFNFAPVGYVTFDKSLLTREANYTSAKMLGRDLAELYRIPFLTMIARSDRGVFLEHMNKVLRFYSKDSCEIKLRKKDGTEFFAALESIREEEDPDVHIRTAIIDITDRRNAEDTLRRQADLLQLTHDTIIVRDMNGAVLFWNRGAEEMYGWTAGEASGRIVHDMLRTRFPEPLEKISGELLRTGKWQGELVHRKKDGTEIVVSSRWALQRNGDERPVAVMEINSDITQKKSMEDKIRFQAHHDALTALPNRRLFMEHLTKEIHHAKRSSEKLGVLFIDLDRFKAINDSLGHAVGDRILQSVSERFGKAMRQSDIIARIGGDEFGVVTSGVNHPEDIIRIAEKLLAGFSMPFVVNGREFRLSSSIGISTYPQDGNDSEALLKNADIAMYEAKQNGRNNYRFFDAEMNEKSIERLMLENSLRQMLNRGELVLHYQPQIDVPTGEIVCGEALARWRHPELGLLNPAQFIPLAEETGLIVEIDEWVLRTACAQRKLWQRAGYDRMCVTVNVSANRFHKPRLVEMVSRVLQERDLPARFLEIEITESAAMQDIESTVRNLAGLTRMGVNLVIDDFGTGYSSLSYLTKLPIKKLKIDKSFISGLTSDGDSKAIVTAILAMAHSMKLRVVAEGVENKQQSDILKSLGCDELQGYFVSKPAPTEEFGKLLNGVPG